MEIKDWLGNDNELGIDIWKKKYQYNNETFEEWLNRVSGKDKNVKDMIVNKEFIFGGRILANRGLEKLGKKVSFSNCYVIAPPEDNLESIFDTAKKLARTYSYGGGCGVDISKLRPRGSAVNNAAESTSGAVSFMDLYNLTTEIIGQKGRRGALMISIDVNHPDVSEFISIKSDLNKIQKANISVKINNKFMTAVNNGSLYNASFTIENTGEAITKEIDARALFKELAKQNWDYAEPGILFWDRIKNWNLLSEDEEFEYAGTNPCAEEPLPAGGSCLLGSLILPIFVEGKEFNFDRLAAVVQKSVKALNDVLDEGLPLHPLEEQRESVRDWRQIGLGVLGVGDMLIKLGMKYGSPESLEFCDNIAKVIIDNALKASALLAKDFGAYPKYKADKVLKSLFLLENTNEGTLKLIEKYGLRNSQLLTIAPTGSIGTMLEISTGIEPNFAFSYTRKTESLHGEDKFYKVYTKIAKNYMEENNIADEKELPEYFVTAQNLNPYDRIKMQSVWQNRIDASISSTINLVNETTEEEVEQLYFNAYLLGLKGMTIYRAGCKREGILTVEPKQKDKLPVLPRGEMKPIAQDTIYYPYKMTIGCGKLKVMIGYSPSERAIQDLYVIRSGVGGCEKNIQAVAIYMSGILRLGGNLFMLEKAIAGVSGCPSFAVARSKGNVVSPGSACPSAILNILKDFEKNMGLKDHEKAEQAIEKIENNNITYAGMKCPECGEPVEVSGGCYTCKNCGYSKCE
jgi:ribonucleoside-diphosphate reductase alpha chain